ncbi:MAG TPA: response regulator transcription factor [Pseudonocardiaceae bacterium]|jgi:DNA-binding response OmpR family regulator
MTAVLVVEDDDDLATAVAGALRAHGFPVAVAGSLRAAESALRGAAFDCVVFDRMLPDGDAAAQVHRWRLAGWAVPVLFLTALDSVEERITGFASGCDDYLPKPFAVAELVARVGVLLRRAGTPRPAVLRYADLELDCARRESRRGGVLLTLSDKEFAILEYLAIRPEQAVSRTDLIEHCWDEATDPMSNVVDVVIGRLRRKLREPNLIQAVRGRGYRLAAPG